MIPLAAIIGPTATGKSETAIEVAGILTEKLFLSTQCRFTVE